MNDFVKVLQERYIVYFFLVGFCQNRSWPILVIVILNTSANIISKFLRVNFLWQHFHQRINCSDVARMPTEIWNTLGDTCCHQL